MNELMKACLTVILVVSAIAMASLSAIAAEAVEYIHTDGLGSPVATTGASGNVIERTVYEPYGAVLNRPLEDGHGYAGHVVDASTGRLYAAAVHGPGCWCVPVDRSSRSRGIWFVIQSVSLRKRKPVPIC